MNSHLYEFRIMMRLADNIWLFSYPLIALGVDLRRNVTVIRLDSGRLVIHSTARFTEADATQIRGLGEPGWLVEGMIDHDTFSKEGRTAFPNIPFLAPVGFRDRVDFEVGSLDAASSAWLPELEVIRIDGAPKMAEHVFFHHPSGTLIVRDLLLHFPEPPSLWSKLLLNLALGFHPAPGFSKRLKMAIDDRFAFSASLEKILALPIRRIVPGHGFVLEQDAREKARKRFAAEGFG